jgi:hypothetical protein
MKTELSFTLSSGRKLFVDPGNTLRGDEESGRTPTLVRHTFSNSE